MSKVIAIAAAIKKYFSQLVCRGSRLRLLTRLVRLIISSGLGGFIRVESLVAARGAVNWAT